MCHPCLTGLRSNQWPGASCACLGSRFTNIYVGWGLKNAAFVPLPPPPVRKQPCICFRLVACKAE